MPGPHGKKKKDKMEYKMGGGMMYKAGGPTKKKVKKKNLAAMYGNPHKITRGDIITAAKKKAKGAAKVMVAEHLKQEQKEWLEC